MKDWSYYEGWDIPRNKHLYYELLEERKRDFISDLVEYFGGDDFAELVVKDCEDNIFSMGCAYNDDVSFAGRFLLAKERYNFADDVRSHLAKQWNKGLN